MDKRSLSYLTLLEEEDPNHRYQRLREILDQEPAIDLTEESSTEDLHLPQIGSLVFNKEITDQKREFFHWLSRQLQRQQSQKLDELTGLYSRSYWEREVKRTVSPRNWSVAMADIDHFKRFNDEYGHDMGDRVLKAVGQLITEKMGNYGYCVRYGGEEVLVLLDMNLREAENVLEQFREQLCQARLFSDQPSAISMSIGVAKHEAEDNLDQSIKMADLALYESKESGRNRLTRYAPYLDYANRLYTWGIFRYLWSASVRFSIDASSMRFLLYWNGLLQFYDWNQNKSVNSFIPNECQQPLRSIRCGEDGFILLDDGGNLWQFEPGDTLYRVTDEDDPAVVRLSGREENFRVVGINNQLYCITDRQIKQAGSLPEKWDYVVTTKETFVVVENILIHWTDQGCVESWPLPERPRQITSSGSSVYMVGESGRLFTFKPSIHRWEQAQFMNMVGSWVPCREVSASGDRMVVLDEHGRLLLIRGDDSHTKSVPQEMNLTTPH